MSKCDLRVRKRIVPTRCLLLDRKASTYQSLKATKLKVPQEATKDKAYLPSTSFKSYCPMLNEPFFKSAKSPYEKSNLS